MATAIDGWVFHGCTGLTRIAIQKIVEAIYDEASRAASVYVYYGGSEQDLEELNSVSDLSAAVIHYNTGQLPA